MAFTAGQKVRASQLNDISAPAAKYSQNTAQTMTSAANTKMQFPNVLQTSTAYVTAGGTNNDTFTTVKTGWYHIEAGVRAATNGAVLELAVYQPGSSAFAVGSVKGPGGSGGRSASTSVRLYLTAGQDFALNVWNSGTTSNVDTTWGTATHISIKYEGP